jgi:hypothetical protein
MYTPKHILPHAGRSKIRAGFILCLSVVACTSDPGFADRRFLQENPASGSLPGLPPAKNTSTLASALPNSNSTYEGEATNLGTALVPTAGLTGRVTWATAANGDGQLNISPPLGGSGPTVAHQWADSVLVISMGDGGDTIAWVGQVEGTRLAGTYVITGGSFAQQIGRWGLTRTGGPGLTPASPPPPSVLAGVLASVRPLVGGTAAGSGYTQEEIEEMQAQTRRIEAYIVFLKVEAERQDAIRKSDDKEYREKKYWDKKRDKKYW